MTKKTFIDLGVPEVLASPLRDQGIVSPFPIQELTIPLALSGADLIGQARTGTGKTLAFGLPLLDKIDPGQGAVQALVITPTRELCLQVADDLEKAGSKAGITVLTIYGGVAFNKQTDPLRDKAVDVVVGTPGRLLDLVRRRELVLGGVRVLVLDEADRMLDMGFLPDVAQLIEACGQDRQTLLFSATMPGEVVTLARQHMSNPTIIRADEEDLEIGPETTQHFFIVHRMDKPRIVARILQSPKAGLATIFVRTKRTADRLVDDLRELGLNASPIHGDLRQERRERNLERFRDGKADILVATEVAARGLDIDGITHVINYDCPDDEMMYLHRVGRTGRAGAAGVAVTFAQHDEAERLNFIRKRLDLTETPVHEVFSTSDLLTELFDLPEHTPWDQFAQESGGKSSRGGRTSSRKSSSSDARTSSRGSGNGSRDAKKREPAKTRSGSSRTKSRTEPEEKPSRKESSRQPAAKAETTKTDATKAEAAGDETGKRVRTRSREVTEKARPSLEDRARKSSGAQESSGSQRSRNRRKGSERARQRTSSGHEQRSSADKSGTRRPVETDAAGRPTEPGDDARGDGQPTMSRRVKVEHIP